MDRIQLKRTKETMVNISVISRKFTDFTWKSEAATIQLSVEVRQVGVNWLIMTFFGENMKATRPKTAEKRPVRFLKKVLEGKPMKSEV